MWQRVRTLMAGVVAITVSVGCSDGEVIADAARDVVRDNGVVDVPEVDNVVPPVDVPVADVPTDEPPIDVMRIDGGCTSDMQCDDRDPCTTNVCDTAIGICGYRRIDGCCTTVAQCDDGNACTTDRCNTAMNLCERTAVAGCCNSGADCNDGNTCTRDTCDTMTRRCSSSTIVGCCTDGTMRSCYAGPAGTMGRGACRAGVQTCMGGTYDTSACAGEVLPAATEVCDSGMVDENCNGMVNEGCSCTGTMTRACYTGPAGTEGMGRCRGGTQACSSGTWAACSGQVLPGVEVCGNAIDEDCNGSDLACAPANDTRANAITIPVMHTESVVTGTTTNATHDGPSVSCACTSGPNVWYRFTLTTDAAVYLDTSHPTTAGPDTSLFLTDSAGTLVPAQPSNGQANAGLCNDDSGCGGVTGWASAFQSRTWGFLRTGTYYIAVGGCSAGSFTLRLQQIPITEGYYYYTGRISGDSSTQTFLIGMNRHSGTCGGRISGEDVYWFTTCGAPQFFSLCEGDGGGYLSRSSSSEPTRWDPVLYTHSGITGVEGVCSDTGAAGVDCRGRIGASLSSTTFDTVQGGARLNNIAATRGVNAILVDERARGSGMDYRLRYRLRDR